MKPLKELHLLNVLELPLNRYKDSNYVLGVKEDDLEKYLISNNYNVYNKEKTLTQKEVIDNDLTRDSAFIVDIMDNLNFSTKLLEDETYLFYIEDEIESRYIEIIQEVSGNKSWLTYSIGDSEDGEMFSVIHVYNEDCAEEYKIIYSFENNDYVVRKS